MSSWGVRRQPSVIASVEVSPAMKKERVAGIRGQSPLENIIDHTPYI